MLVSYPQDQEGELRTTKAESQNHDGVVAGTMKVYLRTTDDVAALLLLL